MSIEDFLLNSGSTTIVFKQIATTYNLEILESGFSANKYCRIVAISLDNIPVMVAASYTTCSTFIDILSKANITPIGEKLFATNSGITRSAMSIDQVTLDTIKQAKIADYIVKLAYPKEQQYYLRQSKFNKGEEEMDLLEYTLPGLASLLKIYFI